MSPSKKPTRAHVSERLQEYRSKRSASRTPEPFGTTPADQPGVFVVQKHAARRIHFDLRLEWEGVLLSWAFPKGFSLDPAEKRLAIQTEDHPLEYADFEGIIPEGNYGAGSMIVWDRGFWIPLEEVNAGLEKGKLLFDLRGYKLRGVWTLVRTSREPQEWLLIKKPDGWADPSGERKFSEQSIFSGLGVDELKEGAARVAALRTKLATSGAPRRQVSLAGLELMLAQTSSKPFSRKGWLFELKYDGYRMLVERKGPRLQLCYRSGQDVTRLFPELSRAIMALPFDSFVADGEVVVLDESGKSSFQRLQRRAQRHSVPLDKSDYELPPTLFLFDLLAFEDFDLRDLPLSERKAFLRQLLPEAGPIRFTDHIRERGREAFEQVKRMGLEGLVAKDASSPYRGGRSDRWLKIPADREALFIIVGFSHPKGSRPGFGALHLAWCQGEELIYAGRVGTGFSDSQLVDLRARLEALKISRPPCSGPVPRGSEHVWVEPRIVCEVRFKKITAAGQLRQPSFLQIREDAPVEDCLPPHEAEQEAALPEKEKDGARPHIRFSNLQKIFWPEEGYTKGDLIDYYRKVSGWMLPYLEQRPVVLDRYPDGIHGKSFFQKNAPQFIPDWITTGQFWQADATRGENYFVINSLEALLYLANLAAIPLHVAASRLQSVQHPDWCILDLDPKGAPFEHVVSIALAIRQLCRDIDAKCFIKTSGGDGLHILLPLGAEFTFEQGKLLAQLIAQVIVRDCGHIATIERAIESRGGKVYVDFLQNGESKLIAAPFCVRPLPGAPVSTPLSWEEVDESLNVREFSIKTVPGRLEEYGDPLKPVLEHSLDLRSILERLAERI